MRRLITISMFMLLCIALAIPMLGFASPRKIRILHAQLADELVYAELDNQPISTSQLSDLEISPDSVLNIYLFGKNGASLFFDQDNEPVPTPDVTMSRLRAAGVEAVVTMAEGEGLHATADLGYSNSGQPLPSAAPYLEIRFDGQSPIMADQTFALECSLSINGSLQEQTTLQIAGSIYIEEQYVSADDAFADIRGGQVLCALDDIPMVALQLHDEVMIYTSVQAGQRYSGTVQQLQAEQPPADDVVTAYKLETVNIDESSLVEISSAAVLLVYDGAGDYLGTTAERLPYSAIYYLCDKRTV